MLNSLSLECPEIKNLPAAPVLSACGPQGFCDLEGSPGVCRRLMGGDPYGV